MPLNANQLRSWPVIGGAVAVAFGLGLLAHRYHLDVDFGPKSAKVKYQRPRPGEFLFLDTDRVAAYLGQLDGGIAKSARLSETLSTEDSTKVSGGKFFEVGASAQRENFVERQVTPTATASFFRLFSTLKSQDQLREVSVDDLDTFERMDEGTFVYFSSRDLRTPIYANSYLVVRQAGTLKALFSTSKADYEDRAAILAQREAARNFAHQVGPNPRIVFSLTPRDDDSIKLLLPVHYRQLTDERSLIKDGGGRFTVVGKLVRIFRKPPDRRSATYVDSPTQETWTKPLQRVPVSLLRRSSRKCSPAPAKVATTGFLRAAAARPTLRSCVMSRLQEQTEIPDAGAVILPVAIYK